VVLTKTDLRIIDSHSGKIIQVFNNLLGDKKELNNTSGSDQ
jgi:hypothetical protein